MSLSDYGEASCECGFFTHVDQRTLLGEVCLFGTFWVMGVHQPIDRVVL